MTRTVRKLPHMKTATMTPTFDLPDRLREAREFAGLTSTGLADRLDVARNTITNYEKGRTPSRTAPTGLTSLTTCTATRPESDPPDLSVAVALQC